MTRSVRRASAAVSSVLVLVLLQILVVASIVSGTRDQDISIHRMDSSRAFYAAEGAMNMAVREMIEYVDDDNDGQCGGVSNNSNDADDVSLTPAKSLTVRNDNSGQTLLTADGRSGNARRRVIVRVADGTVPGRRIIYSQWPRQIPQYRIWGGASWGAASNTLDFGGQQYWAAIRRCPIREEVIIVCSLQTRDLRAAVQTGMTWGNMILATADCGNVNTRPFSLAYEQTSGDALLAYAVDGSSAVHYRTWDGTAWSGQGTTASLLTGGVTWMKVIPKPGSNEIMLFALDSSGKISAMVWDGSSFSAPTLLETSAASGTRECVDAAYEASTGRCLVVWGAAGSTSPRMATWNGSWSGVGNLPDLGGNAHWIHLASDPVSNKLIGGFLDSAGRISVNDWSGTTWGSYLQVSANAAGTNSRCFDVCFEPVGNRGLVMYGHSATAQPRYRIFDGTSWSSQNMAPVLPGTPLLVQMVPSGGGREIMVLINALGGQNRLEFLRWNGSAFVNVQELEPNVSGPAGAEVFMIPDSPPIQVPQLVHSWTESEP